MLNFLDVPRRWRSLAAAFIVESGTGMSLIALGYFFMWMLASSWLPRDGSWISIAALSACVIVWVSDSVWCDTAVTCTSLQNFAHDRGQVIGVIKSFFGLSASILTQYHAAFFKENVNNFLLFLAIYLPLIVGLGSMFLELVPERQVVPLNKAGSRRMSFSILWVVAYAAVLTSLSMVENYWSNHPTMEGHRIFSISAVVATVGCLLVFSHGAFNFGDGKALRAETHTPNTAASQTVPLLASVQANAETVDDADLLMADADSETGSVDKVIPGATLWEAGRSLDFVLMYFSVLVGAGGGIMLINNVGEVNQSYGGVHGTQNVFVSLISVSNCLGRLLAGYLTDRFEATISRPRFLALFVGLMAAGHGILAIPALWVLYPGCIICGLAYGSYWSLIPTLTADFFGFKQFGAIYAVLSTAPSIGGVVLSVGLAGTLYQSHIPPGGGTECFDFTCFQTSFVTIAVLCTLAMCGGLYLHHRGTGKYSATAVKAAAALGAAKDEDDFNAKLLPDGLPDAIAYNVDPLVALATAAE